MTQTPSENIDQQIAKALPWQAELMNQFREIIKSGFLELTEDWKWSVAVWTFNGKLVCAMSAFKDSVKFNFFRGSELSDSEKLFNGGLDSKGHRSVNIAEGQQFPKAGLIKLIQEAVELEK